MQRYRVTGGRPVFGHPPDAEFERDIPSAQEARLLRGALTRVADLDGLGRLSRIELDDLAEQVGVPNPQALSNKTAVIDAIRDAD